MATIFRVVPLLIFRKGCFPREVTHGLFTFSAAPFNSMYFLSLLAVHELHGRRRLPVQLGNREIHSRLKRETVRNDNISQQLITTQLLHVQTSNFFAATVLVMSIFLNSLIDFNRNRSREQKSI